LGLLAMMAILLFGGPLLIKAAPVLAAAVTHVATKSLVSPSSALQPGQPSSAAKGSASEPPCRVLADSTISKALGVRIYPVTTASPDTCQWGLRLDDQSTVVASASTGYLPYVFTIATNAKRAIYQDGLGSPDVSIIVPQHVAVPGSKVPAAQITQPIKVSLNIDRLSKSHRKLSKDQARSLVTTWAQQVATAMPHGTGADTIHP
jgi:hypothetical protein